MSENTLQQALQMVTGEDDGRVCKDIPEDACRHQPKNFFKIDPDEFWEIGMFYGVGGRTFGPTGWIPCTYFARMTEGLDAIAEQCKLIRKEGMKTIELGRLV